MSTGVVILGSTGSIGRQALDVLRSHPDDYHVVALAAGRNARHARGAGRRSSASAPTAARLCGDDAAPLEELAAHPEADVVLNAVVGFAGLPATLSALRHGKRLALANKESLIAGRSGRREGARRRAAARSCRSTPSTRRSTSACAAGRPSEVSKLVVTASGGPFRGRSRAELQAVTVEQALAHPTWSMGAKITIDSSTLMNKGLEVIEAHELFGIDFDRIEVVVHPQSVVHGDGRVLRRRDDRAALDARHAAADRPRARRAAAARPAVRPVDWTTLRTLDFEAPDRATFRGPRARLRRRSGRRRRARRCSAAPTRSPSRPSSTGGCPWTGIDEVVAEVLQDGTGNADEVADVLEADRRARERARASGCTEERGVRDPLETIDIDSRRAIDVRACSRSRRAVVLGDREAQRARHGRGDPRVLRDDHAARVRSLRDGQARGHEGHGVLRRLRATRLVGARRARPNTD